MCFSIAGSTNCYSSSECIVCKTNMNYQIRCNVKYYRCPRKKKNNPNTLLFAKLFKYSKFQWWEEFFKSVVK